LGCEDEQLEFSAVPNPQAGQKNVCAYFDSCHPTTRITGGVSRPVDAIVGQVIAPGQ